jgi:hypothetical protein
VCILQILYVALLSKIFVLLRFIFLLISITLSLKTDCQYKHQSVLPDLKGSQLITKLAEDFRPSIVLDYNNVRDTMFLRVDAVGDSLECIYTGMKLYLPKGQDPTEAVYMNGLPNGINTEHTWPQGLGATGAAQSNMHHLYPSRVKTNSDRGNFAFGNIPDNDTEIWYLKTQELNSIPANRDLYSEGLRGTKGKFEPRESVKGNIARSIFYFYTMYKDQADAIDPNYFQSMKNDICQWHYDDPVDQKEWERNQIIAHYQGDKLNPYVLDCSLVSRAFCNNIDQACELISSIVDNDDNSNVKIYPNPGTGTCFINLKSQENGTFHFIVKNTMGQSVLTKTIDVNSYDYLIELDLQSVANGLYLIIMTDDKGKFLYTYPYFLTN